MSDKVFFSVDSCGLGVPYQESGGCQPGTLGQLLLLSPSYRRRPNSEIIAFSNLSMIYVYDICNDHGEFISFLIIVYGLGYIHAIFMQK